MKHNLLPSLLLLAIIAPTVARADEVIIVHDHDAYYQSDYPSALFARPGAFGLGVAATSLVSGLTGKVYFGSVVSLQTTVGWWYQEGPEVNADLIFDLPKFVGNRNLSLNLNLGFGGEVGFATYDRAPGVASATVGGVDGVVGLCLQIRPVPLEFVVEFRPTYIINPNGAWNGIYFGAGASVRIFFW